jgi:hypothetical protein
MYKAWREVQEYEVGSFAFSAFAGITTKSTLWGGFVHGFGEASDSYLRSEQIHKTLACKARKKLCAELVYRLSMAFVSGS